MSAPTLRIGLFGVGTVGGGVVNILNRYPQCSVLKAYVKNAQKERPDVSFPSGFEFVTSPDDILEDPNVNCVLELMGGTDLAWSVVKRAISKGKHVVTANKALISKYMDELSSLLEANPNVQFLYEAAVCGGIPIIATVKRSLACDRISRVVGIMNGTTNYMLTEMAEKGVDYQDVLKDAQAKGYAEANPAADVEGWDARSKLCILAKLAFGLTVDETAIPCQGISEISPADFEYAKMVGQTIKLLGIAEKLPVGKTADEKMLNGQGSPSLLSMSVSPVMVPLGSPLAHINGAANAVLLTSENLGESVYVGPGAGRLPTANSVVADVLALTQTLKAVEPTGCAIKAECSFPALSADQPNSLAGDYKAKFYVRMTIDDSVGIIYKVSRLFAKHSVSIFSILQVPIVNPHKVPFAIITEECSLSSVREMCEEFKAGMGKDFDFLIEAPLYLRYLS